MSSSESDWLKRLRKEFETAWLNDDPQTIDECLNKAPVDEREELRAELRKLEEKFKSQSHCAASSSEPPVQAEIEAEIAEADRITLTDHGKSMRSGSGSLYFEDARTDDPKEGDLIGRYRLVEEIGAGGMGVVWKAEQQVPVKRDVALKLIRVGGGSTNAIARFEAERQAIAMMEHQNIAKILDADTSENGVPYFVMELVDGVPLDQYCNEHRLTIRRRLELFVTVCNAVQHAHQKGIIHRDLKHSNVLVAEFDGQPVAKIIDFGLAKALREDGTHSEQTLFTEVGRVVGTLQYMSPEQAISSNFDIDTRSDIYSLGSVLYKLLTGSTPLQFDLGAGMSILDILECIQHKEPARPSLRLTQSPQDLRIVSELRGSVPEKLAGLLKGDLDSIVMKAIEKDRKDRYQTANGLAADVQRHLDDSTVLARPQTKLYAALKFVKRNRGLVASLSAISILLVGGIVATSTALIWARAETERARAAEQTAESNFHAGLVKSAWSDWQLGNYQSARMTLTKIPPEKVGWESRFLEAEFDKSTATLFGHATEITGLAASRDGKWIATSSTDHTVKIWDNSTRELVRTHIMDDHSFDVCFSADSQQVAMANGAEQIVLHDVRTGERIKSIDLVDASSGRVDLSPSKNWLVTTRTTIDSAAVDSAVAKNFVCVYSVETGLQTQTFLAHESDDFGTSEIKSVKFLDDDTIATASLDKTARVWKRADDGFTLYQTYVGSAEGLTDVASSPDKKIIVGSSFDHSILIWDFETANLLNIGTAHDDKVWSVDVSPDGKKIVSASADKNAIIWNIDGTVVEFLRGHFASIDEAVFSADGGNVITAGDDHTARIWDTQGGTSVRTVSLGGSLTNTIWNGDFSSDGKLIAAASEDGAVTLVDAHSGRVVGERLLHDCAVINARFIAGDAKIVCGGNDGKLYIWDAAKQQLERTIAAHKGIVWGVSVAPDGKTFATVSEDRLVKIWNVSDFSVLQELTGHKNEVGSVEFSPDGKLLATAGDDSRVLLWNTETYELVDALVGHQNPIWRAVFSPDGNLIASSSYDGEILLWDLHKRTLLHRFNDHADQVAGLTFTPDSSRLVSASDDKTIRIMDVASKTELFVLRDQGESEIVHVSFSPDGSQLISGSSRQLTIRSIASQSRESVLLPQQVEELATEGLRLVRDELNAMSKKELASLVESAEQCCRFYPSYISTGVLGVAKYRLGEFDQAMRQLEESRRLSKVFSMRPDPDTTVECYLILSYLKAGQLEKAIELRAVFNELSKSRLAMGDPRAVELNKLVNDAFKGVEKSASP